jgi:hypothetical protein
MKGKKMEGKKMGLCGLRLKSAVPIFLPNIFLPFLFATMRLHPHAKETAMRTSGIVLMLYVVLSARDHSAMAADRPGALVAMGLGGTLVGSNSGRRTRGMARANANGSAARNDANGNYLENRRRRAEHYFEMRRMNESYRADWRSPGLTPEQLADINESRLPQRLTSDHWQPARGVAVWPAPLRGAEHAANRAQLESLFAERTPDDSGIGGAGYGEVRRLARRMRDQLTARAKEMSVEEYTVARKFLDSLAHEARFTDVAAK